MSRSADADFQARIAVVGLGGGKVGRGVCNAAPHKFVRLIAPATGVALKQRYQLLRIMAGCNL